MKAIQNDQKPRKKVPIPVTVTFRWDNINLNPLNPGGIGKDRQYSTVGEYSSPIYKYIGIDVLPCYAYNDSISITCAEKSEIMNLLWKKFAATFAMYKTSQKVIRSKTYGLVMYASCRKAVAGWKSFSTNSIVAVG